MSAAQYDFEIEQGSSFRISIVYKDDSNNIIDITNWCARLIWKTNTNITTEFTSENTDLAKYKFSIDGTAGKLTLEFPAITTNGFDFSSAKYDLELQSDDDFYSEGGKYTLKILYGNVKIIKRYSKSTEILDCDT